MARRPNPGWFQTGWDPRRHQFTPEERRRGGQHAFALLWKRHPQVARWLLENRIKTPINRQHRNAAILAWAEARRLKEPDDMPY